MRPLPSAESRAANPNETASPQVNPNETASRPATDEEREFTQLSERVRWLADLRESGSDHAGSGRLRRDLAKITIEFKTKNRTTALEALRKLAREADR